MALTGTKRFQNYIGGEWVDAVGGETFESVSPANGDTIGVFPKSGAEDVDRAVAAGEIAAVISGGARAARRHRPLRDQAGDRPGAGAPGN